MAADKLWGKGRGGEGRGEKSVRLRIGERKLTHGSTGNVPGVLLSAFTKSCKTFC